MKRSIQSEGNFLSERRAIKDGTRIEAEELYETPEHSPSLCWARDEITRKQTQKKYDISSYRERITNNFYGPTPLEPSSQPASQPQG